MGLGGGREGDLEVALDWDCNGMGLATHLEDIGELETDFEDIDELETDLEDINGLATDLDDIEELGTDLEELETDLGDDEGIEMGWDRVEMGRGRSGERIPVNHGCWRASSTVNLPLGSTTNNCVMNLMA